MTALNPEVEGELVEHIMELESFLFGRTIKDISKFALDIAQQNSIQNFFKVKKVIASHSHLTLRQPESTSTTRVKSFNRENVRPVGIENSIDGSRFFNVEQSIFFMVVSKGSRSKRKETGRCNYK